MRWLKKPLPVIALIAGLSIVGLAGVYFVNAEPASSDASKDQNKDGGKDQSADDTKEGKTPIPVRAVAIERQRVSSYITGTANLVPESEVDVLAEWEGRIASLSVEEGDRVTRGQVLAELARQDGEILLAKARVRAQNAALAYERARKLVDQELLSSEDFDKVALEHQIAEQELAQAEWQLEKTFIRAPFDGRLTARRVQLGQHVRPGEELFTVADFDPLVARIYVPEKDALALDTGRAVRITLKADEALTFDGRIRQISPVVDTATGTVKVTVEASRPPAEVRPGAFVRIDVVRESRPQAVVLPREALVRELQRAYVFVADDGVARKRPVTLGIEEGTRVEALSGVEAGEQVIVAGQGGLKDGSAVKLLAGEEAAAPESHLAEAR